MNEEDAMLEGENNSDEESKVEVGNYSDADNWLHWLKIVGEYKTKESFFKINISPEKIVLPSMVCLFSLVYAATAILFYLQAV